MSSGIASLHKVLKDDTRQKIILLLNEKGSLGYTELLDATETGSTGLLNYHLKVLGDLLIKDESGQYVLTEKGKLASRLLLEFPVENKLGKKPLWWRKFWIANGILAIAIFVVQVASYLLGYTDLTGLYHGLLWIFGALGLAYMIIHMVKNVLSEEGRLKLRRVLIFVFGTLSVGGFLWIAIMGFLNLSGIRGSFNEVMGFPFAVALLLACYLLGWFIGGWINKRASKNKNH